MLSPTFDHVCTHNLARSVCRRYSIRRTEGRLSHPRIDVAALDQDFKKLTEPVVRTSRGAHARAPQAVLALPRVARTYRQLKFNERPVSDNLITRNPATILRREAEPSGELRGPHSSVMAGKLCQPGERSVVHRTSTPKLRRPNCVHFSRSSTGAPERRSAGRSGRHMTFGHLWKNSEENALQPS
jgi:hypothetical protein